MARGEVKFTRRRRKWVVDVMVGREVEINIGGWGRRCRIAVDVANGSGNAGVGVASGGVLPEAEEVKDGAEEGGDDEIVEIL